MQRILLVDDHAVIRKGIQHFGRLARVAVCGEVANGEEVVRLTKDLKPDIVLMDISVPGMGGDGAQCRCSRLLVEIGYGRRVDARLEGRGGEWNLRQPMPACGPREPNCG